MRKLIVFLLIFTFLIISANINVAMGQQVYTEKVLIDARWGTAPDEFGLQIGEEIEPVGPLTFAVSDNGEFIYIFDTINKQVKRFDIKDKLMTTVLSDVVGTAMCVDSNQNLYLLRGHLIKHYSRDGALIDTYQISRDIQLIEGYGQGIFFDKAGDLFVNRLQTIYHIGTLSQIGLRRNKKTSSLELLSTNQQEQNVRRGIPGSSISNFVTNWLDNHTAVIQILNNGVTVSKGFTIHTPYAFGAVLFKKQDNQGAIYIETERITSDNYVHLEVRKYNPYNEDRLAIIKLPNDYFTTVYKKIHVDNQGNIYQLLTTQNGVKLIKWD